jgi:hypothetical protein
MLLISMLIASTLAVAVPHALAATTVSIEPSPQTFGPASCVGTEFDINIWIRDVTALYGVDIQIGWDTIYLAYVSHTKKIPVESFPDGILHTPTIPVKNQVDETASMPGSEVGTMYWLAEAAMLPALQFDGDGIAATMRFRIVKQPDQGSGEPDVTTYIHITGATLADTVGLPIPCTLVDGEINILAMPVAPPKPVLLRIDPDEYSGKPACTNFESNILLSSTNDGTDIIDLDPKNDVAGFDIVYNFDPTMVEAVSCTIDPDGWFASFYPVNGILIVKNEIDNVAGTIWIVFLGIPDDGGVHTAPYGQGRIVSVTLHAIADATAYPPPTTPITLSPTTVAGFPHPERLYPPWNGSDTSIPLDHFVWNAEYTQFFLQLGRSIDLWTCTTYTGIGPNVPADMVWTQKGLYLCANVTYNLWPVQQKDVAFEIRDPAGHIWGIFYGRTDVNGEVCIFVRLPWPCDDPEQYIGKWKVTATVDIACTVVNDTMEFKYDYRVNIWEATLDAASYVHGDFIYVTIDYGTYSDMVFDVLFTATAVDEVGVPFGFGYVNATAGGEHEWCTYIDGQVVIVIPIPKFAVAGIGTIYVLALSDFPWFGGVAYGPVAITLPFNIEAA